MSDVEPAPAQLICGKGDCERANGLRRAIREVQTVIDEHERHGWGPEAALEALDKIDSIAARALKERQ